VSLPSGCPTVTVHAGPYTDSGGPYAGFVVVTADVPAVVWVPSGQVLLSGPVYIPVDGTGAATVVLPANDSTSLNVTGWTYTFTFELHSPTSGAVPVILPVTASLPQSAPTVTLDLLAKVTTSSGVVVGFPAVLSVAGLSGSISAGALATALGLGTAAAHAATDFDAAGAATTAVAAEAAARAAAVAAEATARTTAIAAEATIRAAADSALTTALTTINGGSA